jgi:hypothetical protein
MTTHKTSILFFLALAVGVAPAAGVAPASAHRLKTAPLTQEPRDNFEIQKVAEGVYALIRKEPLGLWFEANNVFIINDGDVVVVDANISIAATKEVIAARRATYATKIKQFVTW